MKKLLSKLFRNTGFIQGMFFAIGITSVLSYAATNLPGFHVFTPGGVISSTEMNDNFEKIAGVIVVQAANTGAIGYTYSDGPGSYNCNAYDGFTGKLNLTASIDDGNWNLATDTNNATGNATYNTSFSFYEIPTSGWYEVRLVANEAVRSHTCGGPNCNMNFGTKVKLGYATMSGGVPSMTSTEVVHVQDDFNIYDSSSDGVVDAGEITRNSNTPEIKRVYLKSGSALYVNLDLCVQGTTTGTDGSSFANPGDISLTIIKL
jgi:hypothetical protein